MKTLALAFATLSTIVGCGKSGSVVDGFRFDGTVDKAVSFTVSLKDDVSFLEGLPEMDASDQEVALSAELVCSKAASELPADITAAFDDLSFWSFVPEGPLEFVESDGSTSSTVRVTISDLSISADVILRVPAAAVDSGKLCYARFVSTPVESAMALTTASGQSGGTTIALSNLVNGQVMSGLVDQLAHMSSMSAYSYYQKDFDYEYDVESGQTLTFRKHAEAHIKAVYDTHIAKARLGDWFEFYATLSNLMRMYYVEADGSGVVPFNQGPGLKLKDSGAITFWRGLGFYLLRSDASTQELWADPKDGLVDDHYAGAAQVAQNLPRYDPFKLSSQVNFVDADVSDKIGGEFSIKDEAVFNLQCWPSGKIKLYLGGDKPSDAKTLVATLEYTKKAATGAASYATTIPNGTTANTRFWLYPVCNTTVAQGRTLLLPYYVPIENVKVDLVGAITVDPATSYDFGTTLVNVTADKSFTIANTGTGAVTLKTISTAGLGLAAPFTMLDTSTCKTAATLDVDATCTVIVRYAPTAAGAKSATMTVAFNDGKEDRSSAIALSGTGVASALSVSPSASYDYGNVTAYQEQLKTFTFTSSMSVTLGTMTTAGIGLAGNSSWNFNGGTCTTGKVLAAGESCTMILRLFAHHGSVSDTIEFPYSIGSTSKTLAMSVAAVGI